MKFMELFSVPEGKKITEKYLYKVLISSICSILLCMGCLAGTTWAWFTVSIENAENVISVASSPEAEIRMTPEVPMTYSRDESVMFLEQGEYDLAVDHGGEEDDLQQKSALYVTVSLAAYDSEEVVQGYVVLNGENKYSEKIKIVAGQDCACSWEVSWFEPELDENAMIDGVIVLDAKEEAQQGEKPAESDAQANPNGEGAQSAETGEEVDTTETAEHKATSNEMPNAAEQENSDGNDTLPTIE